jgi:hypothetical protein
MPGSVFTLDNWELDDFDDDDDGGGAGGGAGGDGGGAARETRRERLGERDSDRLRVSDIWKVGSCYITPPPVI